MNPSNKNILIYFILLLWLFVLLFFTEKQYSTYSIEITNIEELETKSEDLKVKIKALVKNKNTLEKNIGKPLTIGKKTIDRSFLDKYIINFTENNFIEYFYFIDKDIKIEKISLDKWTLDKNGFIKWKIDLSVIFNSEDQMKDFLSTLISKESKYKFYIEDFKFPIDKNHTWENEKINISLIIYYKNKIKEKSKK